jgi:hypothetical protein
MSPDIKRRIVFTILSDYIVGEELRQVMILWQAEFSERSRYELNQFLGACRDVPGIQQNRIEILSRLVGMVMAANESDLKPDPINWMNSADDAETSFTPSEPVTREETRRLQQTASRPSPLQKASDTAPQNTLVAEVVNMLFSRLRSDQIRSIKSYVLSAAQKKKLQPDAVAMFEQPDISVSAVHTPLEIRDARKLINFTYIGCCEAIGPVDADLLLSKAVREVGEQYRGNEPYATCLNQLLGR